MTAESVTRLPHRFDAAALVGVLDKIGLRLAANSAEMLAGGVPLQAQGKRFTVPQVDDALSKTRLSISDRLTVKTAMVQNGLIARAA